jgi:4-hydroxy-tetrahydrodipicolinate reductase
MVDVAIEFSDPTAAYNNICHCLSQTIPVISGTTGWLAQQEAVYAHCKADNGTFFYASNFSIGMNILFKVNAYLAKLMDQHPEYEVLLEEVHHLEKKDVPSGTAITLAEGILKNIHSKETWAVEPTNQEKVLSITAKREVDVPGTHTVTYTAPADTLEIKHTAHSRAGFALGAVLVAEWLQGTQGILGMDDFLKLPCNS